MSRWLSGAFLVAVVLTVVGCGGGGGGGGTQAPEPTVRFYNGLGDSTAVDFLLDEELEVGDLAFQESTPDFTPQDARVRAVTLRETGTTNEIWAEDFNLQRDRDYLVNALGLQNFGSEPLKRARIYLHEIDRKVPNGSVARLYVVHGYHRATGFTTPPIDFQNPGNNPQFKIEEIPVGGIKNILVDATVQTFQARRTATEAVYAQTTFTFGAGKVYVAYVLGQEGGVGALAPQIQIVELQTE